MSIQEVRNEIDSLKEILNKMASNEKNIYTNSELVNLSQKLDILINKYIHMTMSS
ncbi:Spo0E like sporulation regulatory protein [Alkalithermobacter thermoalcaliphilus JW-YL-7 = DSM 7308]|uniref:Spo0E like sporulation regulatory protein n=1 Tax=Alkalithermobacter thermoalcaliphilus JW-YL-7 = DSM 7308 TaxID=1121328 RepID=A0A150FQD6_CLOPD|nr:Sporulation stage 0, Spo0E-like regulatory phosphatase [[Clostridium] paradoxum JW-YL-7 = DSM 7308]SHK52565.1 Spo0E like sporulation regulatory protein [[Clostridium] paradoxum JW-YL-7 = DSM 7308]